MESMTTKSLQILRAECREVLNAVVTWSMARLALNLASQANRQSTAMRPALAILFTVICVSVQAEQYVETIDGDTFRTDQRIVHLFGIDAPEISQSWGRDALLVLRGRLKRGKISIRERGKTTHGETVAIVTADGKNLSHELLIAGLAWHERGKLPAEFQAMEELARADRRGLWHDDRTIPPWDYRKGLRNEKRIRRPTPEQITQSVATLESNGIALPFLFEKAQNIKVVYVTEYGECYHLAGCRHLQKSRQKTTLDAVAGACRPCKHCKPPITDTK